MATTLLQHGSSQKCASDQLTPGNIYTRSDLRQLFSITASSINNGIFKPADLSSVWIFITETKTSDRTQYNDIFVGNVLEMEGQTKGGTDHLLREHVARGLELLVFYRKKKYEHPGAGFSYEGRFLYQSNHGSTPTKFLLHRDIGPEKLISLIEAELEEHASFDPSNVIDARKRMLTNIVRRHGQAKFRAQLLSAYDRRCAVTGCRVQALLEAAHIVSYKGKDTNVVSNGLLLRADIHTLFDLGLLLIDPQTLKVAIADELRFTEYGVFEGNSIELPKSVLDRPSGIALQSHLNSFILSRAE